MDKKMSYVHRTYLYIVQINGFLVGFTYRILIDILVPANTSVVVMLVKSCISHEH